MGIKFGEIDSAQIMSNEFKILLLEKLLERLMNDNKASLVLPTQADIDEIKMNIVSVLQKKYPKSGVQYKEA